MKKKKFKFFVGWKSNLSSFSSLIDLAYYIGLVFFLTFLGDQKRVKQKQNLLKAAPKICLTSNFFFGQLKPKNMILYVYPYLGVVGLCVVGLGGSWCGFWVYFNITTSNNRLVNTQTDPWMQTPGLTARSWDTYKRVNSTQTGPWIKAEELTALTYLIYRSYVKWHSRFFFFLTFRFFEIIDRLRLSDLGLCQVHYF